MSITKTKIKNKEGLFLYRVRASYYDEKGKRIQKERSVYGLQLAKDTEYLLKKELAINPVSRKNITVESLVTEYMQYKSYEVRANSIRTMQNRINLYILPFLAKYDILKLNSKVLIEWKLSLEKQDLSHTTKKNAYGELRALLNYAVKLEYIPKNPLVSVGNFKNSEEFKEKPLQVYTSSEFKRFIAVALQEAEKSKYYDFYVFFNIAYYTGMRKGEIHALRWDRLDNDTIHIKTSIQQKIKGAYQETLPKNKTSVRNIKIPLQLKQILAEHRQRQERIQGFTEQAFICGFYNCLSDTTIDKKNRSISSLAELHRIRIHDFRHTHASTLIDLGIPITEIARRLGHSDIKETLNTYAHFMENQENKVIEMLEKL